MDPAAIERMLEEADKNDVVTLNVVTVKHMLASLERKINRNLELRMKFPGEPAKFVESELDLDEELKKLHVLATAPELYPELVKHDSIVSLLQLLAHENSDISLGVLNLLLELTEIDTVAETSGTLALVNGLEAQSAFELLVDNLRRLDESVEEEAEGVHTTLHIFENLIEAKPSLSRRLCEKTNILTFFLNRLSNKSFDANKLYCSEMLSIVLQSDTATQKQLGELNVNGVRGVERMLQVVSQFRKREPSGEEERECVENCFDSLCSLLMVPFNQDQFRECEGFELMVRMVREQGFAKHCAVKVVDYAVSKAPKNCVALVAADGLKVLFPVFMGKGYSKTKKSLGFDAAVSEEEHSIAAISWLFRLLPEGVDRLRLYRKFSEEGSDKTERLVDLHLLYLAKTLSSRERHAASAGGGGSLFDGEEEQEEQEYLQLLSRGLFTLQLIDNAIACLACDRTMRPKLVAKLYEKGSSVLRVAAVLQEQADHVGDDAESGVSSSASERAYLTSRVQQLADIAEELEGAHIGARPGIAVAAAATGASVE